MTDKTAIKTLTYWCKKHKLYVIILSLIGVTFSAVTVFSALFIKNVIDCAQNGDKSGLIKYAVCFGTCVILQILLHIGDLFFDEKLKTKVEKEIAGECFGNILKKEYSKINKYHSGELTNRLSSDVKIISNGIASIIPRFFSLIAKLIFAFFALLYLNKGFAILFLLVGVVFALITVTFRGKMKSLHKKVQETEGKTRSFMQESIENLLVVKAFAVGDKIEEKSKQNQEENYKARMRRKNFSVFTSSSFGAVFLLGYAFALIVGAFLILKGEITYGSLTAILSLVNQIQSPIAGISSLIPTYFSVISSTERILEINNTEEDENVFIDRSVYGEIKSIKVSGLTFSYDREEVLSGANLEIKKGEFVSVVGISGIGKSTLLKLLLGVYKDYTGSIEFKCDGKNIKIDGSTRKLFGYVPQGNMLLSGTVRDNLRLLNENATSEEIDTALKLSCADEFIKELPNGLDTVIGERGQGLSEGQVQRLAIARALIGGAPILLFDEATSALDDGTEKRLLENLKKLGDKTLIIVSHRKSALSVSDKVIGIDGKKIKEL